MPQAYVRKLARKHGTSTRKAEGKWAKAKASAAASGHADNYAYVTSIFKNMMHESPYIPTLKDLTRGMSFKYFLVAESDEQQPAKERSASWKHLEKFPQFNELPFKVRRELEREVDSEGLIVDYEMLQPEEKESVDDHLQDMVIDAMSKHFGTGVNVGDWAATDHSQDDDDVASAMDKWETATGMDAETGADIPRKKRKERAPSHIAAMRGPHAIEEPSREEPFDRELVNKGNEMPSVGKQKTYYKPWSALSDEQRAGRAKLAQKHGKLYRIKQSKWFRLLDPAKQQAVVDAVRAGQEVPKF